jgi:hypothetical protein
MKLYHFTDLRFLRNGGTILTEGVKPTIEKQGIEQPPYGVVWLTSHAECGFASREPECCIKLFIPNNDKQLVRWETWLRQHDEHEVLAAAEATGRERGIRWRAWYCYFGIISPSMFRGVYLTQEGLRVRQQGERAP